MIVAVAEVVEVVVIVEVAEAAVVSPWRRTSRTAPSVTAASR